MNKPSVVSVLGGMGLAVLLMVVLALGSMLIGVSAQNELQVQFVARVNAADKVVSDLHSMDAAFAAYRRDWSAEEHAEYAARSARLNADLDAYAALCIGVQNTRNYIRRIRNFNEYQLRLVESAEGSPVALYRMSSYISNGIELHLQQAYEMAQEDLNLCSSEYETAYSALSTRIIVSIGILSFFALAMLAVMAKTYASTVKALHAVDTHFQELSAGNWEIADLTVDHWREFSVLSGMINRMKHEIKDYITQVEANALLEKQLYEEQRINEQQHSMLIAAQMSALRAQVNPHFLFNALNMIGMTAMVDTSESVLQLVEATGMILRYSLYSNDIMTLLDDEVDIVRRYLFLQSRRFSDALTTEVRNELEGEDYVIPSMIIQPVVENCFKHGFGNKSSLHIQLFTELYEDTIQIRVTDNGVGFGQSKGAVDGGIGLENIRRRLALQYDGDERAKVKIESEPDRFTVVTLYIPADKEPKECKC